MKLTKQQKQVLDIILDKRLSRQQISEKLKKIDGFDVSYGTLAFMIGEIRSKRPDLLPPIQKQQKVPKDCTQEQAGLWDVTDCLTY